MELPPSICPDIDGSRVQNALEPSEIDVRAELERILASAQFSVPERVRQFLIYVTNETLQGRGDRIKAYSIAVEVFGRSENFDIRNDPVVRIEAGRLRRALERHYLLSGSADPVVIEIPKGGYVPHFHWRPKPLENQEHEPQRPPPGQSESSPSMVAWLNRSWLAGCVAAMAAIVAVLLIRMPTSSTPELSGTRAAQPEGPSLVVRPFANLSRNPELDFYVAGLGEELLSQLARFKELTVFGRETADTISPTASAAEIWQRFGSRFVLEGGVRLFEGKLRVTSRVLDGETSAIVWSGSYDADPQANNLVDIEAMIASKVATAVAQPYGIIFSTPPRPTQLRGVQSLETYQCLYRFYLYRTVLDPSAHAQTRDCLEQITARYPEHATSWAMLSYIYLDEDRFQLNRRPGPPSPTERAREAAERAVRIDPENVRALQALMAVLYFSKQPAEALRIGTRALQLNPNDTELLAEFGSRVAQAGDWPRGAALIEEALSKNPGHSGYYTGLLALAAYMEGDDIRAADLIRRANLRQFSIYHFVAALIFSRLGLQAETAQSRAEFLKQRPDFFKDFDAELDARNFNARDRAILRRGAIQAGFPVRSSLVAETK